MSGYAPSLNCATQALAMVPIPVIDADAMSIYDRAAENLTTPSREIVDVAALVRYGHAQGQITTAQIGGVSCSVAGITHTSVLARDLLDRLCREVMDSARAHIEVIGLHCNDASDLGLLLAIERGHDNDLGLTIEHAHMLRVGDISAFFDDDLPGELDQLARGAVAVLCALSPLCGHAAEIMQYDDFWLLQHLCGHSEVLTELAEEWQCEGVPSWPDAAAQVSAKAVEYGENTDEALDELARIWPRIDPDADTTIPMCDADTLNRLADNAQACGHTHPVIAYARAVAHLSARVRPIIEHPDNPFDEAAFMPLLTVVTNSDEYQFIDDHAQMMMQSDEGPCVTFQDIDNTAWALLRDVLGAYYAQALAFEALPEYGLCDPYQDKEKDHD